MGAPAPAPPDQRKPAPDTFGESRGEETGDWHLARMGEVCTIMLFLRSV